MLKLNPNHEVLKCRELKCTKHTKFIQEIHDSLISNISISSNDILPHTFFFKIPGWNQHVNKPSDRSKMCYEKW